MLEGADRWMYAGGRPNRVARFLNRIWRLVGIAGLPPRRLNTLEVKGRHSGKPRSFPIVVADLDGDRYLVAMLGQKSNWTKNVRAAAGDAVLIHGQREPVALEEVAVAERPPVLKRYLQLAPGARAHISVDPEAPVSAFEPIAAEYPVFRVRSAE
jgi:deazaflavin-dependent oxidoreductase (nitroreductase family)